MTTILHVAQNGTLKLAVKIAVLVFLAGSAWAKLRAIEKAVEGIDARVQNIERVLMSPK